MRCANTDCGRELEAGSLFCTFCGAPQPQKAAEAGRPRAAERTSAAPAQSPAPAPSASVTPVAVAPKASGTSMAAGGDILVMRAGEQIWNFEESEGYVEPGKRRPIIVMDEQSTHLAHTDRMLSMDELHRRVSKAIETYEVPVDVRLVKARWIRDEKEARERIVASLRGHVFQDIKVIFGLDYMGRWANIHVSIGMEPTQIEKQKSYEMPDDAKYALIGGAIAAVIGFAIAQPLLGGAGIVAIAYGALRYKTSKKAHEEGLANERANSAAKRAAERQSRTYKIDDMRLFCTAMKSVYQAVVDDIVQTGGKVVRIEGGQGGYFSGSDTSVRAPSVRRSDAAESEV